MTRDEAKLILENMPAIEAFVAGKTVQCFNFAQYKWFNDDKPIFHLFKYRPKPEPAVVYMNEYGAGFGDNYDTPEEAKQNASLGVKRVAVKFVEEV